MAVEDLTQSQVDALVKSRHALNGVLYPINGLQPWHTWLIRSLAHLGDASAGWAMVHDDDAAGLTVRVMPCRALLDGVTLVYAGGTIVVANNDVNYVWLEDDGAGNAQISADIDANGWPSTPHLKLAEVTTSGGAVTSGGILDRSQEHKLGLAGIDAVRYDLAITTQGDTGTPSVITITPQDMGGNAIEEVSYLRVRICDSGAYADATNATIAAGTNTTAVETISAAKDLVLKSHTDGIFKINLTDATAETVTLRIGPAPVGGRRGDHANSLNVTHAAP